MRSDFQERRILGTEFLNDLVEGGAENHRLANVVPAALNIQRAEVASLFRDGQLAAVGDTGFDSRDRAQVILIRRADLVRTLPLSVAPPVRRVLNERLVEAVTLDLGNEAESAVEGLGVGGKRLFGESIDDYQTPPKLVGTQALFLSPNGTNKHSNLLPR